MDGTISRRHKLGSRFAHVVHFTSAFYSRIRSGARSKEELVLTPREKEILASFCRGMSYAAMAEERGVKAVTIRNAIYTIQVKLGVGSKQEIVVWAVRNGLLDE